MMDDFIERKIHPSIHIAINQEDGQWDKTSLDKQDIAVC